MKSISTFNCLHVVWEGEGGFRAREKNLVVEIKIKQRWGFI